MGENNKNEISRLRLCTYHISSALVANGRLSILLRERGVALEDGASGSEAGLPPGGGGTGGGDPGVGTSPLR
jgi:hypothetical protein